MSEGWYKIELTDDLRTRPLPDAVFQVQHEFLQRYDTTLNNPSGALLLANFELDRPEQVLPSVLYYYLSPPAVRMLQHLLYQYGARPCAEPSVGVPILLLLTKTIFRRFKPIMVNHGRRRLPRTGIN